MVRRIKVYPSDLHNDELEGSHQIEKSKRTEFVFYLILNLILTLLFILGLIKAVGR